MKLEEILKEGKKQLIENGIQDASFIARILLQFVLKIERNEILQKQEEEIEERKVKEYKKLLQRMIKGIPLQYITNQQEFMKLPFYVDENVLIPQPDTEILVEEVISIVRKESKNNILDLCTGSGCIGISLAYYLEEAKVTMSDISKKAIEIAKKNAKENGILDKVSFTTSNLFEKIEEKFDIIVSNPPYIKTKVIPTLEKQVQKEPLIALDGGEDGLLFYRNLVKESIFYLKEDGYLCLEIGYDQKEEVSKLIQKTNVFSKIETKQDLAGNDRVILCQKRKGEK